MKNLKVIPNHITKPCYICKGKNKNCPSCDGTGKYKQTSYYMIYTTKSGQKIGFQGDTVK